MTRAELKALVLSQIPNNTQQLVSPVRVRTPLNKIIDELFHLEADTTDKIKEGTVNLFYKPSLVRATVVQLIQPSLDGRITWTYNAATGTLTPTINITDEVAAMLAITSNGQTAFTLPIAVTDTNKTKVFLNGQLMSFTGDYTLVLNAMTWVSAIKLELSDEIKVFIK